MFFCLQTLLRWFSLIPTRAPAIQLQHLRYHCRYSSPLYVDITKTVTTQRSDGSAPEEEVDNYEKTYIGEVPIMLRSTYCNLFGMTDRDLTLGGECPYDQVRGLARELRVGDVGEGREGLVNVIKCSLGISQHRKSSRLMLCGIDSASMSNMLA